MAAFAVAPPISVDEYLRSVYEPDMDFVDGVLEDRNSGEFCSLVSKLTGCAS